MDTQWERRKEKKGQFHVGPFKVCQTSMFICFQDSTVVCCCVQDGLRARKELLAPSLHWPRIVGAFFAAREWAGACVRAYRRTDRQTDSDRNRTAVLVAADTIAATTIVATPQLLHHTHTFAATIIKKKERQSSSHHQVCILKWGYESNFRSEESYNVLQDLPRLLFHKLLMKFIYWYDDKSECENVQTTQNLVNGTFGFYLRFHHIII